MKATGIVRRIDDLGRVVIPKEIRRTMRIREGDPLEIYTSNDGEVIFKKYSAVNEMAGSAAQVAEVMTKLANCPTVVFDRDHVVAVAGVQKKEFNERRVTPYWRRPIVLNSAIGNRSFVLTDSTVTPQLYRIRTPSYAFLRTIFPPRRYL